MTVEKIEYVIGMIEECRGTSCPVASVWEYTHKLTGKQLYAVFTTACYCDIGDSPYVESPFTIYCDGKWLGKYDYLNG